MLWRGSLAAFGLRYLGGVHGSHPPSDDWPAASCPPAWCHQRRAEQRLLNLIPRGWGVGGVQARLGIALFQEIPLTGRCCSSSTAQSRLACGRVEEEGEKSARNLEKSFGFRYTHLK